MRWTSETYSEYHIMLLFVRRVALTDNHRLTQSTRQRDAAMPGTLRNLFYLLLAAIGIFAVLMVIRAAYMGEAEVSLLLNLVPVYFLLLIAVLSIICFIFLGLVAIYSFLKLLITAILKTELLRSTTLGQKLVGLVIAAIAFPTVLTDLYSITIRLGFELLVETPRAVARVVSDGLACIDTEKQRAAELLGTFDFDVLGPCVPVFVNGATGGLTSAVNGIVYRSGLLNYNVVNLFFALAIFLGVTVIIFRTTQKMDLRSRFWLAYGSIAIFSIYLALSATLAVPLMKDESDTAALPADQLRDRLEALVPPAMPLAGTLEPIEVDAASETGGMTPNGLAEIQSNPEFETIAITELASVTRYIRQMESFRGEVARRQRDLAQSFQTTHKGLIDSAVDLYQTETVTRLGQREATRHYLDILNWFRGVVGEYNRAHVECGRVIDRINAVRAPFLFDRARLFDIASRQESDPDELRLETRRVLDDLQFRLNEIAEISSGCQPTSTLASPPPNRPFYGSSLGPVGSATRWLLSAESMPVTLITGLVGFGLLGSLVSRFIRDNNKDEKIEDIGEVAVVVFGGFAAALVVYVGAYGGIAIASESGGDPNPYVVFGACLVGAVFSTDVWSQARRRFSRSTDQRPPDPRSQELG